MVGALGGERLSEPLDSPYAPPTSRLEAAPSGPVLATRGQRFATLYLDWPFLICSLWAAEYFAGDVFRAAGPAFPLLVLVVLCGDYVVPEWAFGATPGKLVSGTRVVSADGSPLSLRQITGRTLARAIPGEPLSVVLRRDGVAWHDSLSGTRVIRKR